MGDLPFSEEEWMGEVGRKGRERGGKLQLGCKVNKLIKKKRNNRQAVEAHAFNPSTQQANF